MNLHNILGMMFLVILSCGAKIGPENGSSKDEKKEFANAKEESKDEVLKADTENQESLTEEQQYNNTKKICITDHRIADEFDVALKPDLIDNPSLHGNPSLAVNGIRGGGEEQGSLDVFSLDKTVSGEIILSWKSGILCDGEGVDFKVYENPFKVKGSATEVFIEPLVVSVSQDGINYLVFPQRYEGEIFELGFQDIVYGELNPDLWKGFAGLTPVHGKALPDGTGWEMLFDDVFGGDGFDLSALPESDLKNQITAFGVRFIKLQAASTVQSDASCQELSCPRYPNVMPSALRGEYADIDGLAGRYFFEDE